MKKQKKAFTLMELMVAIAIIGIMALGIKNMSFNSISNKQRLDGFFYQIKTNIETIKNNVLIGRQIDNGGGNLITSDKWQIDFSNNGSGSISTYYYDNNDLKKSYTNYNIEPENFYDGIICNTLGLLSDTGSILINGKDLTLTGAGISGNDKVLEITAKYKDKTKVFTINAISGVIEEK